MRFDDRLKTVMTQPVADAHDRTVRWRQIVDLLSRPHDGLDPALFDAALTMIRSGLKSVPLAIRAATARSIAGRPADAQLLAIFAADKLEVAAPLIASAALDEAGWQMLAAAASADVAAFIHTIRGTSAAPHVAPEEPAPVEQTAELAADEHIAEPVPVERIAQPVAVDEPAPSIGEMVARIERLKTKRGEPEPVIPPAPEWTEPAAPISPSLFRWECDASGQIEWVDGAPRGALIGRSLPGEDGADRRLIRAFADRMPFDGAPLALPQPALPGEWKLSGIPAFSPVDGRFLGYRGIARRDEGDDEPLPAIAMPGMATDADALRETIHEIKTPLNAIIGFAEIIDGQYLGPAHRNYRLRAAEIVAQARVLLAAIEDLDFAARMQGARAATGAATALDTLFAPLAEELMARAAARDIGLRLMPPAPGTKAALAADLAERLIRRFFGAVIDAAAPTEQLRGSIGAARGKCVLTISRPAATVNLGERQLLDPAFHTPEEGEGSRLGLGFALRLVRGLARLAGGDLVFTASNFALSFPLAKA